MTTTTSTSTAIAAPPERVWQLLTDADWWNRADNGVADVTGAIAQGHKVKLVSEVDPKRSFKLTVDELSAPTRMVWTGGMPLGLFTGRRTFEVAGAGAGCTFSMTEDFTGPLSPLIIKSMPDLQGSFDQFAAALKADSEG